jgi:predicted DNA-binding transcriptional regulator AlpA
MPSPGRGGFARMPRKRVGFVQTALCCPLALRLASVMPAAQLDDIIRPLALVTVEEFAILARLSRRQIDRLRKRRPEGFPHELDLGSGSSKYRRCPRFRLAEVQAWLDSRALW